MKIIRQWINRWLAAPWDGVETDEERAAREAGQDEFSRSEDSRGLAA